MIPTIPLAHRWFASVALALAALGASAAAAPAAPRAVLVASGFAGVTAIVPDPVLRDTMYVAQLDGRIFVLQNGNRLPTPFLDLNAVTFPTPGERGLLGMAFPPDAASSGRVFVHFNDQAGNTVIARFTRSAGNPRIADPASRFDLRWPAGGGRQPFISQPEASHKGGHLAFGPDGYLYIGLGDGGGDNDPSNLAQNPATLLGKMLRVNVSVPDGDPIGYAIPPGNPTFPVAGALPEIWAFGLRNPWRYSFDDFGVDATDALIIADVGQSAREEINFEPRFAKGRNYGWRPLEGTLPTPGIDPPETPVFPATPPIYEYPRSVGASITGGYVYRGAALPALHGRYVYGDCIAGRIWSLGLVVDPTLGTASAAGVVDHTAELLGSAGQFPCITSFARDAAGELYFTYLNFSAAYSSSIYKIVDGAALPPGPPTGLAATVTGNTVALSWTASTAGGATTSYQIEIGSAPSLSDLGVAPLPTSSLTVGGVPNGTYYIRVRGVGPAGVSGPSAEVPVVVGCTAPPPAPIITGAGVVGGVVSLAWTLPPGATGSRLEIGLASGATSVVIPNDATTLGLSAPVPPSTYFARLRAVNSCGTGAASAEQVIVVP